VPVTLAWCLLLAEPSCLCRCGPAVPGGRRPGQRRLLGEALRHPPQHRRQQLPPGQHGMPAAGGEPDRHGGLTQLHHLAEALGVPHVGAVQQASTQPEPGNRIPGRQRLQQVRRSIAPGQLAVPAERADLARRVHQLVARWPEVTAQDTRVAEHPAVLQAEVGRAETTLGVTRDPPSRARPLDTQPPGNVAGQVPARSRPGTAPETKNIILVQHPCALRVDGINLATSLIVAEVVADRLYAESEWQGNYKIMPLPRLSNEENPNYVADFMSIYLAISDSLELGKRVASMSPSGVNLLLQRFMYHNSRGVLPTWKYNEVTSGPYEEADCIEEWCSIRVPKGLTVGDASVEAAKWLDDDGGSGVARRSLLENPQHRSRVRKAMKKYARTLEEPGEASACPGTSSS
jgi:hypothetical protein